MRGGSTNPGELGVRAGIHCRVRENSSSGATVRHVLVARMDADVSDVRALAH